MYRIAGEEECEAYGRFLGERFRRQNDRIIWVMGGDLPVGAFPLSWHRAVARGIARGVPGGVEDYDAIFCSHHVAGRGNMLTFPPDEPFMDFNTIQSGHWNTKPYEPPSEGMITESLIALDKPCPDFELKSPDVLAAMLEHANFRRGRPIITHCDGGGRAFLDALTAARAGHGPVMNYYLSLGDWAADASCPIERPADSP